MSFHPALFDPAAGKKSAVENEDGVLLRFGLISNCTVGRFTEVPPTAMFSAVVNAQ